MYMYMNMYKMYFSTDLPKSMTQAHTYIGVGTGGGGGGGGGGLGVL